ncbi:MAG: DUF1569 domain-containing protein [Ginsengibacter sp.]
MPLPNIFSKEISDSILQRINNLRPFTQSKWGKMSVAQMLAHCNVTYEMIFENIHAKPNGLMKFILKTLIKNKVVSETPYKQNNRTAPQFIIKETKDFDAEKQRLINYITKTQNLGETHFANKQSHSFGKLNVIEWNNMLYKHLNHHLNQFGV